MKKSLFFLFTIFLFSFTACSNSGSKPGAKDDSKPRINLDKSFYYSICEEGTDGTWGRYSTLDDAVLLEYSPLQKMEFRNLYDLAGSAGKVLWLKTEFTLTPELKNKDLSLVIPYLHFADKLYLNGRFIDEYGIMEPDSIQEAGYTAHLFDFSKEFLNQNEKNTVYIKVLTMGLSTISPGVFVGTRKDAWAVADIASFWQSRIYMPFEGVMFAVFVLFVVFFIFHKKERVYLYFALINLFSIVFFSFFYIGDLPWIGFHGKIPFLFFVKASRCICFFGMEFMTVLFVFEFLRIRHHKIAIICRAIVAFFCILFTIAVPDYITLLKATPILLGISAIDLVLSFLTIIGNIFYPQKRKLALYLFIGAMPIVTAIIIDLIIKLWLRNINIPYISLFGWQGTIIFIFIYFSMQYRKISSRLEYLNTELENEVEIQTRQLKKANERLDTEMKNSQLDMKAAARVQKKLFHPPENNFSHWDIAVAYQPLSIVSGDFYNFYNMGDSLYGVSLFDASGHGVSASLITMLAENIIQSNFKEANIYGEDVAVTLERINSNFIAAKGDVDNYLTGLLLHIVENGDDCTVSMVGAAHPYPELYHADEKYSEEILPDAENPSFGPIGMDLIDVHYSPITLNIKKDDVLVLFTDGLVEAMNENRVEFGRKELKNILKESCSFSSQTILHDILQSLSAHVGMADHTDDVTIIVMKRK